MQYPKKPKIFYGYWIVVVAFFCTFITSGCGYYTFSLFVKPLQTDFGWDRGEIMVAFTILLLSIGMALPFVGRLIDRYGAREVIGSGAFVAGLGFILLSLTNRLWNFYASYLVTGIGIAAMGQVPASAIVSNWFKKRRGTTLGIMATGLGAGGLAMAPLVGGYLIPNFGWRAAYLALALLTSVLVIPLAWFVVKTKPADMGLYPDGVEAPEAVAVNEAPPPMAEGLTLRMALATPVFWLICVSFLTNGFSQVGIVQSQVPHLDDVGFPVAAAAAALGGVGLGSTVGKFFFGWLCDRIPPKYAWCIAQGLQVAAIIIIMSIGPASPLAIVWLYAIVMGLGVGGWLPAMSMLTSTSFGLTSYGAIFGAVSLIHSAGSAIGPLFAGYMYDSMNTYQWAFVIFLALYAVAIPVILAVRRPKPP